jgi:hypothetical protein
MKKRKQRILQWLNNMQKILLFLLLFSQSAVAQQIQTSILFEKNRVTQEIHRKYKMCLIEKDSLLLLKEVSVGVYNMPDLDKSEIIANTIGGIDICFIKGKRSFRISLPRYVNGTIISLKFYRTRGILGSIVKRGSDGWTDLVEDCICERFQNK